MDRRRAVPTRQEREVLRAIAKYGTVSAAAEALVLSPHTVDAHLDHLRQKTGLHKTVQLIAWAAEQGWLYDIPASESASDDEKLADSGEGGLARAS